MHKGVQKSAKIMCDKKCPNLQYINSDELPTTVGYLSLAMSRVPVETMLWLQSHAHTKFPHTFITYLLYRACNISLTFFHTSAKCNVAAA